jgi:putative ABC transport system substrate-binding protein
MTQRREFIALLGGAAAWPLAARAQQGKPAIIGLLGSGTAAAQSELTAAFVRRLRELGWSDGRNLTIEYRWAEGRNERFAEIAAEFVRLQGRCYCYAQHSPAARGQAGDIGDPDRGLATARPRSARRSGQSLDKGGGPLGL